MATCKRKVAQLNELMDFLPFGLVQPQTFTGMVITLIYIFWVKHSSRLCLPFYKVNIKWSV